MIDGGVMEIEVLRDGDRRAGRHRDQFGKTAGPLDAHHAARPVVAAAVLGADFQRHDTRGGDPVAAAPASDLRPDRVDDAGAIDAGNKRQHRPAILLPTGAQAYVEDAIDGRRVHLDADFAGTRHRVRHILVAQHLGRTIFVDDNRLHSRAFVAAPSSQ